MYMILLLICFLWFPWYIIIYTVRNISTKGEYEYAVSYHKRIFWSKLNPHTHMCVCVFITKEYEVVGLGTIRKILGCRGGGVNHTYIHTYICIYLLRSESAFLLRQLLIVIFLIEQFVRRAEEWSTPLWAGFFYAHKRPWPFKQYPP